MAKGQAPVGIPSTVCSDEGKYKTLSFEKVRAGLPRTINQKDKRFLITDSYFDHLISRIEGLMLTIIEASTEDKEKREALKSVIRRTLREEARDIFLLKLDKIK